MRNFYFSILYYIIVLIFIDGCSVLPSHWSNEERSLPPLKEEVAVDPRLNLEITEVTPVAIYSKIPVIKETPRTEIYQIRQYYHSYNLGEDIGSFILSCIVVYPIAALPFSWASLFGEDETFRSVFAAPIPCISGKGVAGSLNASTVSDGNTTRVLRVEEGKPFNTSGSPVFQKSEPVEFNILGNTYITNTDENGRAGIDIVPVFKQYIKQTQTIPDGDITIRVRASNIWTSGDIPILYLLKKLYRAPSVKLINLEDGAVLSVPNVINNRVRVEGEVFYGFSGIKVSIVLNEKETVWENSFKAKDIENKEKFEFNLTGLDVQTRYKLTVEYSDLKPYIGHTLNKTYVNYYFSLKTESSPIIQVRYPSPNDPIYGSRGILDLEVSDDIGLTKVEINGKIEANLTGDKSWEKKYEFQVSNNSSTIAITATDTDGNQATKNVDLNIASCYALIIGIDNYENECERKLTGAIADALQIEIHLREELGVKQENIYPFIQETATREKIDQALKDIKSRIEDRDMVFIYFAGIGTVIETINGYEKYFLLAKSDFERKSLSLREILDRFQGLKSKVVVIADCGFVYNLQGSRSRIKQEIAYRLTPQIIEGIDLIDIPDNVALCFATSRDHKCIEKNGRGIFTSQFLQIIKEEQKQTKANCYIDLMAVKNNIIQKVRDETSGQQIPYVQGRFPIILGWRK